ncbi:MAG: hypothetical protein WEA99_01555 [Brumimicrobium sp.]
MVFLAINLSRTIANFAWGSLILLVVIILYRLLLKRLKRGRPSEENFLVLHPLDKNPASGTVQIYLELKNEMNVLLTLYSTDNEINITIAEGALPKGGNIISFDSSTVPNGEYFYEAKTDFQKTSKKITVKN